MSNNGETKARRVEGIVDPNGNPVARAVAADTELLDEISEGEDAVSREQTTTIDPRRMSTDLLFYNLMRSAITEVSLAEQLRQVAFLKKQNKHLGDLPGEGQVRQMLSNCQAHRTILALTARDRFKDFDAAYFARTGVEPYTPPTIEVEELEQPSSED